MLIKGFCKSEFIATDIKNPNAVYKHERVSGILLGSLYFPIFYFLSENGTIGKCFPAVVDAG